MSDTKLPCLILCGGASRRFEGEHKAFAPLGEKTVLQHVIDRVEPQCREICLNAPEHDGFELFELPLCPDGPDAGKGPLAGVLTAMNWADKAGAAQVLTCSNDTPFIPLDWAQILNKDSNDKIRVPAFEGNSHFVCALWPVQLKIELANYLASGDRSVQGFVQSQAVEFIEFSGVNDFDPFFNVNTPDDLRTAAEILQSVNRR
ncbi:MAG: molybdenum cofactor guanylyltransferase [Hyphomonadaceae bacterium]|nr:molybdenum cofactor guanylyltransferase [Hyphomonadaceae bacterium]